MHSAVLLACGQQQPWAGAFLVLPSNRADLRSSNEDELQPALALQCSP